jgi:hypothetical protein
MIIGPGAETTRNIVAKWLEGKPKCISAVVLSFSIKLNRREIERFCE